MLHAEPIQRLLHCDPFDVGDGELDLIYPGLDVLNSEVGAGPLKIRLCLVRQVCTNGLTISFWTSEPPGTA